MGTFVKTVASQIVVVAAGLAAYHFLVGPRAAKAPPEPPATAPPPAPPAERTTPTLGVTADPGRVDALDRRIANLERAYANVSALVPGTPAPSAGSERPSPAVAPVWTEDQLTALRGMLKEIETRKQQDNYETSMRAAMRGAAKTPLDPDAESRALTLLVAFQRKIAEIYPSGSAGTTPEERAASMEAASRARAALDEELRKVLPADAATRVLSVVPPYTTSLPGARPSVPPAMGPR